MEKMDRWLLADVILIVLILVWIAYLFLSDILVRNQLLSQAQHIAQTTCNNPQQAQAAAQCYVDGLIGPLGLPRTQALFNGAFPTGSGEPALMLNTASKCLEKCSVRSAGN